MHKRTAQTTRVHAIQVEQSLPRKDLSTAKSLLQQKEPEAMVEEKKGELDHCEEVIEPLEPKKFLELKGDFEIRREIGRGSYGVVFKGLACNEEDMDERGKRRTYAIKRIFPTINAGFVLIEMVILKLLNGENNVTDLINVYRLEGQISLVFRYQKNQQFVSILKSMDLESIRCYMYCLVKALSHLAEFGIMHRDLKPSNFLYDQKSRTGLLIDFGLSEIELDSNYYPKIMPENENIQRIAGLQKQLRIRNRTGTKGYMAPESLFRYSGQTSKVDVWAAGVIFLSLLSQRHPIFSLNSNSKIKNFYLQNLIPLTCIFGSRNVKEISYSFGYGCIIPEEFRKDQVPWLDICEIQDPVALDLLDKMLQLHPQERVTAKEALSHEFFRPLREKEGGVKGAGVPQGKELPRTTDQVLKALAK